MKSFRLHHKLFLLPSCTKHLSLHLFRISFGHIKKHGYCLSHVLTSPYLRKRMTFGLEFIYCTLGFKHVLDLKVVRLIGRLGWLVPENPFLQTLSSFKKVLSQGWNCWLTIPAEYSPFENLPNNSRCYKTGHRYVHTSQLNSEDRIQEPELLNFHLSLLHHS